jgi:hypothetical protein
MPQSLTVLGTYRRPFAVALGEDCSGLKAPTRIAGFDATAVLPSVTWGGDMPVIDRPPVTPPAAVLFIGEPWGEPGTWDPVSRHVDVWWARGLFLTMDAGARELSRAVDRLSGAMALWTSRLASWIEAIAQQDVGRTGPSRVLGEQLAVVEGYEEIMPAQSGAVTTLGDGSQPVDAASWTVIVRSVGEGLDVPDEHRLLSDARAWLRRQDYRRAIIDAASAAELVLTELLDWKLAASSPALDERLSADKRTLTRLKDLLAPLVPVDKQRLDRFVTTRNEVMHKSYVSTHAEATEAVAIAEELVALIYPIDALLGS